MNKNTEKSTTNQNANPFNFAAEVSTETKTRRLDFTPALQDTARARATDLVKLVSTERLDLADLANKMMDTGAPTDLLELIRAVYDDEKIKADAAVLDDCPDEQLAKMLESQRSNRSKAKRAGLRVKLSNTVAYIAAMYAELLIREKTGKSYNGTNRQTELDYDQLATDTDMLGRKINSLASKKSRLTKLAQYDEAAKAALEETEAELARLRSLRPTTTKSVVKSMDINTLREVLSKLDESELPDEVVELMKKLG